MEVTKLTTDNIDILDFEDNEFLTVDRGLLFEEDDDDRIFEPEITIRFVEEDDVYSPVMYEELPSEYQNVLDNLASELLDPYRGKVSVVGTSNTGKSFLIHQLIGNIDRYLNRINLDKMNFIHIDDEDLDTIISLPNRYQDYISTVMNTLDCTEREICFYTEEPSVAARLSSFTKKAGIILEASHSTIESIAHLEHSGATKVWGSWHFFDVNEIFLKKKDLVDLLYLSLHDTVEENFNVNLSKRDIMTFLNYSLRQAPELLGEKNRVLVPIGIWAVIIRRMGGVMGLSESSELRRSNNELIMSKVISTVFKDNYDMLAEFLPDESDGNFIVIPTPDGGKIKLPMPAEMAKQLRGQREESEGEQKEVKQLKFNDLEEFSNNLHKAIIGQDSALEHITESMIVPAAGLNDDTKPLKSFLFLGPTGVGKTKAALTIAENVAKEQMNVVRIDMSEYGQAHEAAKLLGAPPGYAGFENGGVLTNAVKTHPNSLILLDEIEKAHPKIWDSFLQIFDAGRMTDGTGNTIDFTQTIIVMTSNLGAGDLKKKSPGFNTLSDAEAYDKRQKNSRSIIMKAVEEEFRAEMINRIDELVIFNELSQETARNIVRKEISVLNDRMGKRGYKLDEVNNDIIDEVLSKANVSKYGAREIQRVVLRTLSNPIAKSIVTVGNKENDTIVLSLNDDKDVLVNYQ